MEFGANFLTRSRADADLSQAGHNGLLWEIHPRIMRQLGGYIGRFGNLLENQRLGRAFQMGISSYRRKIQKINPALWALIC